MVYKLFSR